MNGLDPEGIRWIRTLLQRFAAEGRTVVVSSHLMSEMEETADHVLVIGRGRLIADTSISEFTLRAAGSHVHVVSPDAVALAELLERADGQVTVGRRRRADRRRPARRRGSATSPPSTACACTS